MKQQYNQSSAPLHLALLRRYVLILLAECRGDSANLLRDQVRSSETSGDLRKLRPALFECMCMHLGEAEAMDRVRSLDLSS